MDVRNAQPKEGLLHASQIVNNKVVPKVKSGILQLVPVKYKHVRKEHALKERNGVLQHVHAKLSPVRR